MIKIGHVKDIDDYIPICIISDVKEELESLDYYYGEDRDIDKDMGGFIVICGKHEVLNIPNFNENISKAEYTESTEQYQKSLYISGTERNIIIYRCLNDERMLQK